MEHKGLVKALKFLANSSATIDNLIIDQQKQISKYIRQQKPSIYHPYDVGTLKFVVD